MYIIATLLLIVGTLAGVLYGFMLEKTHLEIIISGIVGGFAGSAAGGLIFTYLYLTSNDDEEPVKLLASSAPALEEPPKPVKKPMPVQKPRPESDKKRIKRLEKEIQAIKNKRSL